MRPTKHEESDAQTSTAKKGVFGLGKQPGGVAGAPPWASARPVRGSSVPATRCASTGCRARWRKAGPARGHSAEGTSRGTCPARSCALGGAVRPRKGCLSVTCRLRGHLCNLHQGACVCKGPSGTGQGARYQQCPARGRCGRRASPRSGPGVRRPSPCPYRRGLQGPRFWSKGLWPPLGPSCPPELLGQVWPRGPRVPTAGLTSG